MTVLVNPVHPGEILKEDFLVEYELSAGALAKEIRVPRTRIERLANKQTRVTADTALRLSRAFGTTPEFWINLQTNFDMALAREHVDLSDVKPLVA